MKRVMRRMAATGAAVILLAGAWAAIEYGMTARAQAQETGYEGSLQIWHVPFGITRGQTALYNYSNFAPAGAVLIQWAFTDAHTGEVLRGNFGSPRPVPAMTGRIWELNGDEFVVEGQRREIVAWLEVTYPNRRAKQQAVDITTVEVVDNLLHETLFMADINVIRERFSAGGDSGSL